MSVTRLELPGAWYCDATPARDWCALYPVTQRLRTSHGDLDLPPGGNLLYLRLSRLRGLFCIAGQGHGDGQAWLWSDGGWRMLGETYGSSPCAFGPDGLYISRPQWPNNVDVVDVVTGLVIRTLTQTIGARGIADVDTLGVPHNIDGWYGEGGFAEYTDLSNVRIGQGAQGGIVVRVDGALRLLELGSVQFIRASREGDRFAIAAWKDVERGGVIHWASYTELAALPLVTSVTDPPPVDPPPPIIVPPPIVVPPPVVVVPPPVIPPPIVVVPPVVPPKPAIRTRGGLVMLAKMIDPTKQIVAVKAVKPVAGTTPPLFTLILPNDRVFSCQGDGSAGERDPGTEGGWEKCRVEGNVATFKPTDTYYTWAFVEVAGL